MSEIRCPMCGKPNPDNLDVCQFCGARLKPLISGAPQPEEPQASQPAGEESFNFDEESLTWLDDDESDEVFDTRRATQTGSLRDPLSWLDGMSDHSENTPPKDESGVTDWLSSLQEESSEAAEDSEAMSTDWHTDEGLPDWLAGEPTSESPQAGAVGTGEEELPDWLAGETAPESPQASAVDTGEEELPDWLAGEPTSESPQASAVDTGEEELPDWLAGEPALESPQAGAVDTGKEELPDWLAGETAPESPQAGAVDTGEEELPDWLAGEEDLPDWLSTETGSQEESPLAESEQSEQSLENLISADTSSLPDIEVPDWLADISAASAEEVSSEEEIPSEAEILKDAIQGDDWLDSLRNEESTLEDNLSTEAPVITEEDTSNISPFTLDESLDVELGAIETGETPDWLAEVTDVSEEEAFSPLASPEEEAERPEIERANLPSWLQEMKPLDAVSTPQLLPEDQEAPPVPNGPLAGLRGVLPVGIQATLLPKSAPPSAKLEISEEQETQIGLLRSMLESEGQPVPLAAPPRITRQRLLRWLIGLLLLTAIGWGIFSEQGNSIQPVVPAPEVRAVFQQVDALPPGKPVLLVFDYQTAYAGEMDATIRPLLAHLMIHGTPFATVSTHPEGMLLAEHALSPVAQELGYRSGEHYINLGYIPGGATGMANFAQQMRKALPTTAGGLPAWESPLLQNVNTPQDFGMLIVLADDPDTARMWVEQVGTRYPNLPLMLGLSAQAAPMLAPYYPTQVDGSIAGALGGAAYERQTGLNGPSQERGTAFSLGILAAVLLIIVGASIQFIWTASSQNNHKGANG